MSESSRIGKLSISLSSLRGDKGEAEAQQGSFIDRRVFLRKSASSPSLALLAARREASPVPPPVPVRVESLEPRRDAARVGVPARPASAPADKFDSRWDVVPDTRPTNMTNKITKRLAAGEKIGLVMVDAGAWPEGTDSDLRGSLPRMTGLLQFAREKNMPVFHVEIEDVHKEIPPQMVRYANYHAANKTGSGCLFSGWPAVRGQVDAANLDSLVVTGAVRDQCVKDTIFGEAVFHRQAGSPIIPGSAACLTHKIYTGAMYTYTSRFGGYDIAGYTKEKMLPPGAQQVEIL